MIGKKRTFRYLNDAINAKKFAQDEQGGLLRNSIETNEV